MSDRDIGNWDDRLKKHVEAAYDNYIRRRIHLDSARVDLFWGITGEYIYIEQASSASASMSVKLDRNTKDSLDLVAGTKIETVFKEIYLTNTVQAGEWIDLIIGINFKYNNLAIAQSGTYARSVVPLTHANPNTDVSPATQICNRVVIKADIQNTGIAWIDFHLAAVQNSCFPLDPGESVIIKLQNLDEIHANFEIGGEYVFIIYEL